PDAPKGGILRRSAIESGQFDHILPYIDKGIGVSEVDGLLYAPLAVRSFDEPYTVYGLIARNMERGPEDAWLRFEIDPRATFAEGKPGRAEDGRFTFELLMSKGSLKYRTQFADVTGVT
ncbi:ABC transporter substrate-binding protein, partial [Pseudomonas syringae]